MKRRNGEKHPEENKQPIEQPHAVLVSELQYSVLQILEIAHPII